MDSTYHATPAEHVVLGWAEKVPPGFHFALKLPQELTPEARPVDGAALGTFAERALLLGDKLGPVLVQLGPEFAPASWDAIAAFLAALPAGPRWAIEFRHRGWFGPKLLALLEKHRVALALVEGRGLARERVIDLAIRPTADFAYVRWMATGGGARIEDFSRVQVNRDRELSAWAVALAALAARVTEVYGYFGNHFQGHAPASVREMQRLIGLRPVEPGELGAQPSLF